MKIAMRPPRQELIDRNIIQVTSDVEKRLSKETVGARLNRRLSMRPTQEELEERNILKSEFFRQLEKRPDSNEVFLQSNLLLRRSSKKRRRRKCFYGNCHSGPQSMNSRRKRYADNDWNWSFWLMKFLYSDYQIQRLHWGDLRERLRSTSRQTLDTTHT